MKTREMEDLVNCLQNDTNFRKIYFVVAEIWHLKLGGSSHLQQKFEILKVNISEIRA